MLLPASGDQPMTEEAYGKLTQEQKRRYDQKPAKTDEGTVKISQ